MLDLLLSLLDVALGSEVTKVNLSQVNWREFPLDKLSSLSGLKDLRISEADKGAMDQCSEFAEKVKQRLMPVHSNLRFYCQGGGS